MALATLTKGPVGFLVPLLTAGLYLTAARRWTIFWQRGFPLAGTVVVMLLAGPWYAAMFLIHGDEYSSQAKVHTVGDSSLRWRATESAFGFMFPCCCWGFSPGA